MWSRLNALDWVVVGAALVAGLMAYLIWADGRDAGPGPSGDLTGHNVD